MKVVINVHGGVVQDVYVDDPDTEVVLVDWDTEGCIVGEHPALVAIEAADGKLAHAALYPTAAIADMPADMQEAVAKASA